MPRFTKIQPPTTAPIRSQDDVDDAAEAAATREMARDPACQQTNDDPADDVRVFDSENSRVLKQ